ncbi:MAG: hypothetical protein FWG51_03640 [Firmicutes bacterium]|nr:hypothetical protein [Bacillota bacterium]
MKKDELSKSLLKKAQGFSESEITEEYDGDDGNLKLKKRKVSTKYFPPDISAAKLLLMMDDNLDIADMTDEQLRDLRAEFLAELKNQNEENKKNDKEDL